MISTKNNILLSIKPNRQAVILENRCNYSEIYIFLFINSFSLKEFGSAIREYTIKILTSSSEITFNRYKWL